MSDQRLPTPAPEPAFFDNPAIDNLIAVTMELGAELWVQRERMRVIERLLAERGVVTADAFAKRLYAAFTRETEPATPDGP